MVNENDAPRFTVVEGEGVVVHLQTAIYSVASIQRAAHRMTDRCHVHLAQGDGQTIVCRLQKREAACDLEVLAGDFVNEALDQVLRERLAMQTEPVRRLLLAQAYSRVNLLHPELDTPLHTEPALRPGDE